jgi:hypothetical protein
MWFYIVLISMSLLVLIGPLLIETILSWIDKLTKK